MFQVRVAPGTHVVFQRAARRTASEATEEIGGEEDPLLDSQPWVHVATARMTPSTQLGVYVALGFLYRCFYPHLFYFLFPLLSSILYLFLALFFFLYYFPLRASSPDFIAIYAIGTSQYDERNDDDSITKAWIATLTFVSNFSTLFTS